jgi:hypothetical protein
MVKNDLSRVSIDDGVWSIVIVVMLLLVLRPWILADLGDSKVGLGSDRSNSRLAARSISATNRHSMGLVGGIVDVCRQSAP